MDEKKRILQRLLDSSGLEEEGIPGQSVVELLGDRRVLVENHRRIIEYDLNRICLQLNCGAIQIVGCNLRLRAMTGRKLLITGKIDRIEVCRGRSG